MRINCSPKLDINQALLQTMNEKSSLLVGSTVTVRLINNVPQEMIGQIVVPAK